MKVIDQIVLHNLQIFDPMPKKMQNYFEAELVSVHIYIFLFNYYGVHAKT
jgi:hypothetical protein